MYTPFYAPMYPPPDYTPMYPTPDYTPMYRSPDYTPLQPVSYAIPDSTVSTKIFISIY